MLYECVTGTPPFDGQAMALLQQHIHSEPPPPWFPKNPLISSTLEDLILALLEKSPVKRPTSGNVVARALAGEVDHACGGSRASPPGHDRAQPRDPADRPPSTRIGADGSRWARPSRMCRAARRRTRRARGGCGPCRTRDPPAAIGRFLAVGRARTEAAPSSYRHPVAREMLSETLARPIVLSPDERYLCGHYLAYLLGGPRRRGLFLRRPLDERNADRRGSCSPCPGSRASVRHPEAIEYAAVPLTNAPRPRRVTPCLGDQVPGQPGHARQAPGGSARSACDFRRRARTPGRDARPQGSAQSRHAAQEPRRSRPARPAPRRPGRTSRVALEPRHGRVAAGHGVPTGGPPLCLAIGRPRLGRRGPLAGGR